MPDTAIPQIHGPAAVVALTGSGYRCQAHLLRDGELRHAMPVMGMRVFYGRRRDGGGVAQFSMTGRGFRTAEAQARMICDLLWDAALAGDLFEVYGERLTRTAKIDLTPVGTTALALAFGRAMGAR